MMQEESDSNSNKRKRSQDENEGKASQKKTALQQTTALTLGEKASESGDPQDSIETVAEKTESKKKNQEISQCDFELKSAVSGSETLNGTEIKPEVSVSENQSSASTSEEKANENKETQDNVKSADENKEQEEINQESLQMDFAVNRSETLNGTEIKPEVSVSEIHSSASTSEEKASENEGTQDNMKSADENKEQEINQKSLQMDFAVNGSENLNETGVKPETSSESQASTSTSGENTNENQRNEDSVKDVDEMKEPAEISQESSQRTVDTSTSTSGENSNENQRNEDSVEGVDEMKEPVETSQESSQRTFKSIDNDWRSDCYSVTCLPNKARKEGLFTDIQFVMGDGDKRREFHAHKSILACASSVFEKMFYGPLPEERSVIETDDDPDAFEMLLDYIYGSGYNISSNSLTSVCKFSAIGNKYLVPEVEKTIKTFILCYTITESDFWNVFEVSNFNSLWPLFRDKFESYIMENADELISSEKFLNLPETILNVVLQMNKLNIEEYPLLIAVTKWAYHNKGQVTTNILKEYYKHIRFSTISSDSLIKFIDSYPEALDTETYLQILHHTNSPSAYNLPEWCSTSKRCRNREFEESSKHRRRCSCYDCDDSSEENTECRIQ